MTTSENCEAGNHTLEGNERSIEDPNKREKIRIPSVSLLCTLSEQKIAQQ